ncbi:membrane protein [Nocardia sputorum]|uniref:Membrane protein n=2 Tax=Nocardiaceae TaxID=85025 RepID=A0ABN6U0M7_9NOCA|nr:membrane protein [Nocardia sputorum]BDT98782.1 membrane protein [Nocardia sputorum]
MSDQPNPMTTDEKKQRAHHYRERLWVPLWWWPVAFAITGLLAAEIHMGAPGLRAWLPYVVLFPVPVWVLLWLSRHRVEVAPDANGTPELRADRAHLPVNFVARAAAVAPTAKSAALGRQLDPAAYVQHRPWVGPMVLLVLDDPDDPTPYWLVSTRRPERVLAALGLPSAG